MVWSGASCEQGRFKVCGGKGGGVHTSAGFWHSRFALFTFLPSFVFVCWGGAACTLEHIPLRKFEPFPGGVGELQLYSTHFCCVVPTRHTLVAYLWGRFLDPSSLCVLLRAICAFGPI